MSTTSALLLALLALAVGLALGALLGGRRRDDDGVERTSRAVAPVKESLDRFDSRLRDLEASRVEWHAQLREQVEGVRTQGELLRRETASLSTALRRPHVRGRWGELHLQRAVELAGMVEHCDFETQAQVRTADGALRPDLVVRLAGGKQVVVDAKVPLDAFLDASGEDGNAHLTRHAAQLRAHVDGLASKAYWKQFAPSPEFVVLFVPGESFLAAALETEPGLLEYAAARKVVLATPTTLIALLRTVAYAWTEQGLADNARAIHTAARELYERLATMTSHLDKLGRGLSGAVNGYNAAMSSLESRVLVSARRLQDLDVTDAPLDPPRLVDQVPPARTVTRAAATGASRGMTEGTRLP